MRIEDTTIIFKSREEFFELEKSGEKPNTVRILNYQEAPKIETKESILTQIRIENRFISDVDIEYFERELTNISLIGKILGHFIFVFSWRHKEE